ncbi:hypothetical protein D0Q02_02195 [Micromonospora craniellae]|uniref:Uncharacterized protein n=1 Tax=Micromonospora craniellae TaxID=2294034 RepID=A0A372G5M6_9ACTN|nr:hypothetical protein D0Q02_02195 [Micromonospora craniellae]
MGMAEWTLCADQKVYARLHVVAKPTGESTPTRWTNPTFYSPGRTPRGVPGRRVSARRPSRRRPPCPAPRPASPPQPGARAARPSR